MSSTTICMADTSVIPFPTFDSTHSSPRSSPPLTFSDTSTSDSNASEPCDMVDFTLRSRSARYDSGSSSSSTPSDEMRPTIIPRSKRVATQHSTVANSQDIFNSLTPASTPIKSKADERLFVDLENRKQIPLHGPSDEEDTLRPFPLLRQVPFCKIGKLRLEGSAGKHVRQTSDSSFTVSQAPSANQSPQTTRKKSGQPIKSSLKGSRRPDLHVVTNGPFAKSEPATPTHKAVHFDSKLEHVKLFLAEQKPLAVSRDGSPTSDTSGDEFPSFIYGDISRENKCVRMLVPNMPSFPRKEEHVALQDLILSQDQRMITGNVRIRNIAYEKWLAIRFTLDWWQTTSEVTARYEKSVEDGTFDIFTFTIRLHDIWSRIEEKTIFIALRYTVAGQEYWDNNAGKNYHIKFVLDPPSEPPGAINNDSSLKDLNTRLEGLAKTRSAPIPITPYRLGRSFSADHEYSSFAKPPSPRYDFTSTYKTRAKNLLSSTNHHSRTLTYPSGAPATAGSTAAPWSKKSKGNETEGVTIPPRPQSPLLSSGSSMDGADSTPTPPARSETKSHTSDGPTLSRLQDGRERNHRRGFIDGAMDGYPHLRRTPPGSPLKFGVTSKNTAVSLPRTRSFPLTVEKPGPMGNSSQQSVSKPSLSIQIASDGAEGSEETTPSSSSSTCTPLLSPGSELPRSETSYKQFLDQFCFYTGGDTLLQEPSEAAIPRSQSTSGIEHYFLSHSPPPSFSISHAQLAC